MRPTVMVLVGHYLPGYRAGGPIRTIANMVDQLGSDFDFRIVTSDRDLGSEVPYASIKVNAWNTLGSVQVYYTDAKMRSFLGIMRIFRENQLDVLYLNSFFSPDFTIKILLLRLLRLIKRPPLIVAPRGEFSQGALNLKSLKKHAFIRFARLTGLYRGVVWHASSEMEAADIKLAFGVRPSDIHVASDIACAHPGQFAIRAARIGAAGKRGRILKICFLSRVVPMKNLDYALSILSEIGIPAIFDIFGPKEDAPYWRKCEELVRQLPPGINVTYHGGVENSRVGATIGEYDVFFMPSRGENFGHVYFEALASGVPILTSDQTPWRDLQRDQVGWDIPLDRPGAFVAALREVARWDDDHRHVVRQRCVDFARLKSTDPELLATNRQLFLRALSSDIH